MRREIRLKDGDEYEIGDVRLRVECKPGQRPKLIVLSDHEIETPWRGKPAVCLDRP